MSQKGLAQILLVVLVAVAALGGGYLVYQNFRVKPVTPPTDQVACTQDAKLCPDGTYVSRVGPNCEFAPCPSPESTGSAKATEALTMMPLNYSFYTERFIDLVSYPKEITQLPRSSLKNISCSERFTVNEFGFEFERVNGIPQKILKELLDKEAAAFILCDLGNNYLLIYENWGGGGGNENIAHISLISKELFSLTYITEIPREGAYFGCFTVHGVTNDNNLYIECGGGDVAYSYSVYKINLLNKARMRLLQCYGEPSGDGKFTDTCKDEAGKIILSKTSNFP